MAENDETATWFADDVATFGDRLLAAREAAGLGQAELASKLGVRDKTLAAWEEDLAEPRGNRLQMLAGMLNVSLRWLLTGIGDDVAEPGAAPSLTLPARLVLADIARIRQDMRKLASDLEQAEDRLNLLLLAEEAGTP
ncbi:helix-turn-helix domain-containing protein [Tabrizicola sp.]|uniref:helix-turn-helix domain-containing protein n=1 Tax=Tabrizicola sp. TaxID=2005166 RepID=UPI002612552A|nr:helix-turn-helix domain-containing protein [Tabrizicola sp.]MDM7932040.1 helix-turn-helix domain-containing protein [Tabrizicola sp.]